jgi:ribosome-associated heat shock protein Hsp15
MMEEEKIRIDKWLWAARFFKTRSLAAQAVAGGHVHVNGSRVKAARTVQQGDRLEIRRGAVRFEVIIIILQARRGPAEQARAMYEETPESLLSREKIREERKLAGNCVAAPSRRPDKRDRRKIRKLQRRD